MTEKITRDTTDPPQIRALADAAKDALFALEAALGPRDDTNPHFDLRQRVYRARIEVSEAAWAHETRITRGLL